MNQDIPNKFYFGNRTVNVAKYFECYNAVQDSLIFTSYLIYFYEWIKMEAC